MDGLLYRDEVLDKVKKAGRRATPSCSTWTSTWSARAGRTTTGDDTIALIYGVGGVIRGKSDSNPLSGEQQLGRRQRGRGAAQGHARTTR